MTNSLSSELEFILERLMVLHRQLVELLEHEYALMAQMDVPGLLECATAKEMVLHEIVQHENLRIKLVENLASAWKLDPMTTTLRDISEKLASESLRVSRDALVLIIEQAKNLNLRNMEFAEGSLGRIEELKRNVLGMNNNNAADNYSDEGKRQPNTSQQGGRLLSTEA